MTLSSCSFGPPAAASPYSEASSDTKNSNDLQGLAAKNPFQECVTESLSAWSKAPLFKGIISDPLEIFPIFGTAGLKAFLLVTGKGQVLLREMAGGLVVRQLLDIPEGLTAAAISCQAGLLALAPKGGARIYKFSEIGNQAPRYNQARLPKSNLHKLAFDIEGRSLFVASDDAKIYRWRLDKKNRPDLEVERYAGSGTVTNAVVVHPAADFFISGDWQGGLYAWRTYDADVFKGQYDRSILGPRMFHDQAEVVNSGRRGSAVEEILLANNLKYLFIGSYDGKLELWRVRGFLKVSEIPLYRGLILKMAQSPSGNRLASLDRDGQLKVLNLVEAPKPHFEIQLEKRVAGASVLTFIEESRIIVVSRDGTLNDISF